jgi:hypothetical protein
MTPGATALGSCGGELPTILEIPLLTAFFEGDYN